MIPTTVPPRNRPVPTLRPASLLLGALLALGPAPRAGCQEAAPTAKPATSFQDALKTTPDELAVLLKSAGAEKPLMLHVGFRVLFSQAHIPGSQYAGPGANQAGLDAVRKAVATLPKTKAIVLYCGCCPWERCPNMEQPWRLLVAAGFTNVKVLYIPKNFGTDWVQKGYPVEASAPANG
jgi:thiosulfate/3-mercaptopyruvate sulfurtransferase